MTVTEAMSELGRAGGSVKSPRKAAAARENGRRGGRRPRAKLTTAQIEKFADKIVSEWRELSK